MPAGADLRTQSALTAVLTWRAGAAWRPIRSTDRDPPRRASTTSWAPIVPRRWLERSLAQGGFHRRDDTSAETSREQRGDSIAELSLAILPSRKIVHANAGSVTTDHLRCSARSPCVQPHLTPRASELASRRTRARAQRRSSSPKASAEPSTVAPSPRRNQRRSHRPCEEPRWRALVVPSS